MSYFTLRDGQQLYYEDKGQGTDILIMLHGWTSNHEVYEQPVALLQKQARCIIYDHRGHGGSKNANSGNPTMETLASDLQEKLTSGYCNDIIHIIELYRNYRINRSCTANIL